MTDNIATLPRKLQNQLCRLFSTRSEIQRVYLFGSRARGDAEERSDIDLMVVAPELSPRRWLDLLAEIEDTLDTLLLIDIVRWDDASPELRKRVLNEGQVVYEQRQNCTESEQS